MCFTTAPHQTRRGLLPVKDDTAGAFKGTTLLTQPEPRARTLLGSAAADAEPPLPQRKPKAPPPRSSGSTDPYAAPPTEPYSFSPVPNPELRNDSVGQGAFGARRKRDDGTIDPHRGVDILAEPGTVVYAPISGRITEGDAYRKTSKHHGQFRAITIEADDGTTYVIRYATVRGDFKKGARVEAGRVIGHVEDRARIEPGMRNHVHVEKYKKGQRVDPTPDLTWWRGHRGVF